MRWIAITISIMVSLPAEGQDLYSTGTCDPAQAETILEVGNVRARLFNDGALFWKGQPTIYEVPAGGGVQSLFSANLLVAGLVDNQYRAAGSRYGPYEFWPGPLPVDGTPPVSCTEFDRFWNLDFDSDLRAHGPGRNPTDQVKNWPVDHGAPFTEVNGISGYQPEDGDLPLMFGDRQVFWIMNDRGGIHDAFHSEPLGLEVRVHAFGFDTVGDVGNATFYRYHIINRGSETIEQMAVGMHVDGDLGNFDDDYLGTDTTSAMFYFYNADNFDESDSTVPGYGESPPAVGISIVEASSSDGRLPSDLGAPPSAFLTSTVFPYGGAGIEGDPDTAEHIHHFMNGRWKDGRLRTEGGSGIWFSEAPMPFWTPGDPVQGTYWSEINPLGPVSDRSSPPADRHGVMGFGTFDLPPDESVQFTFAVLWARGDDHLDSVSELRGAARFIHENKAAILAPRTPQTNQFEDGNPSSATEFPFWLDEPYPNPADDRIQVEYSTSLRGNAAFVVHDILGREVLRSAVATGTGPDRLSLDVSGLSEGVYSLSFTSWSHSTSKTFVVMR